MSDDEMWQKFSDCAAAVLTGEETRRAFDALGAIEPCSDVRDIAVMLSPAAGHRG